MQDPEWRTEREPGDPPILEVYVEQIEHAMAANDFRGFSRALESAHNAVHMYCGGDLSNLQYASYDPLDWAIHAFLDKLWADWQHVHPNAFIPANVLSEVLVPFNMTAESTIDHKLN